MLLDNVKLCFRMEEFDKSELKLFEKTSERINRSISILYDYDTCYYNNIEEEHKLFLLNIIKGFKKNYSYYHISNENLQHHTSFNILFKMIYSGKWSSGLTLDEIYVAFIFAFYSLILLESYGDSPSIEDLCIVVFKLKKNSESFIKIQSVFYGITLSNHPLFVEIRGRILFPHRYDNMFFEYKL